MLRLPARFAAVILCFAPLFRQHTWRHAQVLLLGAILVPGQRTVTSILRIGGLCRERRVGKYPPRRSPPARGGGGGGPGPPRAPGGGPRAARARVGGAP